MEKPFMESFKNKATKKKVEQEQESENTQTSQGKFRRKKKDNTKSKEIRINYKEETKLNRTWVTKRAAERTGRRIHERDKFAIAIGKDDK